MGKSLIYSSNATAQALASGSNINFGSVVRRYGQGLNISGGNLIAQGNGYYKVDTNVSFTATAGTAVLTLHKDGTAIPGATTTVTTVADTSYTVSIPAVI